MGKVATAFQRQFFGASRARRWKKGVEPQASTSIATARGTLASAQSSRLATTRRRRREPLIQTSEEMARQAVENCDTRWSTVQKVFDVLQIPSSARRPNVIPRGVDRVAGMLFGMYSYGGRCGVTKATFKHPWLVRLLVAVCRVANDFAFTSIQLNYNYASRPHVDKNNLGSSLIVGFGEYDGGQLWSESERCDGELVAYTIDDDEDISHLYRVGQTFLGRVQDIKERWTMFDGNRLHFTLPFSGTRYSLVYFVSADFAKLCIADRTALANAGITFDFASEDLVERLCDKRKYRQVQRKTAADQRKESEAKKRGRCVARIWAQSWGLQCSAIAAEGTDMCRLHLKGDAWKVHGRFDGDVPLAKAAEMFKRQQYLMNAGAEPPSEPWTQVLQSVDPPTYDVLKAAVKCRGSHMI